MIQCNNYTITFLLLIGLCNNYNNYKYEVFVSWTAADVDTTTVATRVFLTIE